MRRLRSFFGPGSAILCSELALVAALGTLSVVSPIDSARSATRPLFSHPVHRGSTGKQVLAAKWVLAGQNQGLRKPAIHTFHGVRSDECGRKCVRAILDARWLLGEPVAYRKYCRCRPGKRAVFDRDLYLILTGQRARPLKWVGRASDRIARVERQRAKESTRCAKRIVRFALHELALGVHEIPDRSNDGPRIRYYQQVTGAYGCPGAHYECPYGQWCASFVQRGDLDSGVGTIANRSARVFYIVAWAHDRGWLRSRPVVGAEVAYMQHLGHTGFVVAVGTTTFTTIEGNSGNAVRMHVYPLGYRQTVFIVPPCVAAA